MVYASLWRRTVASIIDLLVLAVCYYLIVSLLVFVIHKIAADLYIEVDGMIDVEAGTRAELNMFALSLYPTLFSFSLLYHTVLMSSAKQGTFGKMAMGIIVTDMNGNKISCRKATVRFFSSILSILTLGIGYLMAGFTKKKQTLHDVIAGSLVLKKRRSSTIKQSQ
ncbi:MAG: RDD family protein [Hormoscilla sp.]